MSASVSSSSRRPRTPPRGRTNPENEKQQIRLVAYTPPSVETEKPVFRAPSKDVGNDSTPHMSRAPMGGSSTSFESEVVLGSALSSSEASSPNPPSWTRSKDASGVRLVSDLPGSASPSPTIPAPARTSVAGSIRLVNMPPHRLPGPNENELILPPIRSKPPVRRNRVLSINSDKTFSIMLKPTTPLPSIGSETTLTSYPYSHNSLLSHENTSFALTDDHPSSIFSRLPGRSSISTQATTVASALTEDHGPWPSNFHMVGGLRQVPKILDTKDKGKGKEIALEPLPTLEETTPTTEMPDNFLSLAPKPSFVTENSISTLEETANYKVLGPNSPQRPSDNENVTPPPSSSNYHIHGKSSFPQSFTSSPGRDQSVIGTPESRNFIIHDSPYPPSDQFSLETPRSKNFVVHGDASPSPRVHAGARGARNQPSFDSFSQESLYSQESLVIPPLRPHKRSESEKLHLRTPGGSPHRRSNSYSSISSVFTQETTPNVVLLPSNTFALAPRQSAWTGRMGLGRPIPRMDVYQRSSQLSTVVSEHEDSDHYSQNPPRDSSVEGKVLGNPVTFQSHSRSESLDRPNTVVRSARELPNPLGPTIRDHDEHGDGLADLKGVHQLQSKSSRGRLGFLSRQSSDRSLRSSISSRSRASSFASGSIPTWARLYYGSGERRWLGPHIISEDDDCEPITSWTDGSSPPQSRQNMGSQTIYNPRRRPREPTITNPLADEIVIATIGQTPQAPKKKTSSVWSPHLGLDRRVSRFDVWQPPSVKWSAEKNAFGRRNSQVVLFVVGFVFPFAWMTAALLPLPTKPQVDIEALERNKSRPQIQEESQSNTRVVPTDDSLYQSARWWRNVNRYMSVIGILILGTIVALSVLGVQQKW